MSLDPFQVNLDHILEDLTEFREMVKVTLLALKRLETYTPDRQLLLLRGAISMVDSGFMPHSQEPVGGMG